MVKRKPVDGDSGPDWHSFALTDPAALPGAEGIGVRGRQPRMHSRLGPEWAGSEVGGGSPTLARGGEGPTAAYSTIALCLSTGEGSRALPPSPAHNSLVPGDPRGQTQTESWRGG